MSGHHCCPTHARMVLLVILLISIGLQKTKVKRKNFTVSSSDIQNRSRVFFANKNWVGERPIASLCVLG